MTDVDRGTTRAGTVLAVCAAAAATVLLALATPLAGAIGVTGLVVAIAALHRASPALLATALAWYALAVLVSTPTDPTATALTVVLCVVCWDTGTRGIRLGRDLTRSARTARLELSGAATTGAVGLGSVVVAQAGLLAVGGFDATGPVVASALGVAACVLALARL